MSTMEELHPHIRLVPSGKVYRQMFDAEVQLVKALEKREASLLRQPSKDEALGTSTGIPLVHQSRDKTGTGILDNRQKSWIDSFPNEPNVENPVVYRFISKEQKTYGTAANCPKESNEVRGLPDVLSPAKVGSDIIERIGKSRAQRHENILEDLHQELGLTNQELEPQIQAVGQQMLKLLHEDDMDIQQLMDQIRLDDDVKRYTLRELMDLWNELSSHSVHRRELIIVIDKDLAEMEEKRMKKVREIFERGAKLLEKVAHLMPPDLQRLLNKESQLINQTVLSNRRAYTDLYSRLMMADIEREKRLHTQWEKRTEDWARIHTDIAINGFKAYMENEAVVYPPRAEVLLENMKTDQISLNQRRLELVDSLKDLKPPASTKASVYHWNQQVTDVSKEIDTLNQDYFSQLYSEYEKVCQACLQEVERIQDNLVAEGICTEEKAKEVVRTKYLPLVGQQQTQFEKMLEEMDKAIEVHNAYLLAQLKSLFKFCQGSAHLWDVHEVGLARQEHILQEKLDLCRQRHDNINQEKEAQLDILMDIMRQDSNENTLKENLAKAFDKLKKIRAGYDEFHGQQLEIVASYPQMIAVEVGKLDIAICKFYSVDRRNLDQMGIGLERAEQEELIPGDIKNRRKTKGDISEQIKALFGKGNAGKKSTRNSLQLAVNEVLNTERGTAFYVLTVAGEHGIPREETSTPPEGEVLSEAPLLTEGVDTNWTGRIPSYLVNADVPDKIILNIKKAIRMNFLNYLEYWFEHSCDRARSVVSAKTEELNSELDLRVHLHQPRSRRAELDVHNVRAAELVMHSERVARHTKGITQALSDLKTNFNDMTEEHNNNVDKFRHSIETLEVVFIKATKSAKLVALSHQLQVQQNKYMDDLRTSLRKFRQHLDDTLHMLRESNARFIKSFKVFSDGGNFCPEEISDFRKRLEKMAHKIDASEGSIMADLEGMESKRLEQVSKISIDFEDRFKHHMVDLVFMERVGRWLTNTQLKIKTEVAFSNAQAQKLTKLLNDLHRRIDACLKPNPDKEIVSPEQLNDGLRRLYEIFHDRSVYLKCITDQNSSVPSTPLQGNPAQAGMRVGFAAEAVPPTTKLVKMEDSSISLIKNILRTQKALIKGSDLDVDDHYLSASNGGAGANQRQHSASLDARHHRRSIIQPPLELDPRSKKNSHQGTPNPSITGDGGKSGSSAKKNKKGEEDEQKRGPGTRRFSSLESIRSSGMSTSFTSLVSHQRRARQRYSKGTKLDPKYMVFSQEDTNEDSHFLGKVRHILREALDGLLSAGDIYYRAKGSRPVTRPQALQETFEQCADIFLSKLLSYFSQADDFHNQCLQELRQQLQDTEMTVTAVPKAVIIELLNMSIRTAEMEVGTLQIEYKQKLRDWDSEKADHQASLRPTLGHPQQEEALVSLCHAEDKRSANYLAMVDEQTKALQDLAAKEAQVFVNRLAKTAEQLLLQSDALLTIDDVDKGRVPKVKRTTSELLRRQTNGKGEESEDEAQKAALPRGRNTWTGLPRNAMKIPSGESVGSGSPEPSETRKKSSRSLKQERKAAFTASVTTAKTTLIHSSSIEQRDHAYRNYQLHFERTLGTISSEHDRLVTAENRWIDSWKTAVNKVKKLY